MATCRVVLGILPGLEVQVLADTEGLIKRLFDWASEAREPLQSYATGLLAVAMEIQDIATDSDFRARNDKLIPVMIQRIKELKKEALEQRANQGQAFKRPFSMFNNSPSKSPSRRISFDNEEVAPARSLNPGWPSIPSPVHHGANVSNGEW